MPEKFKGTTPPQESEEGENRQNKILEHNARLEKREEELTGTFDFDFSKYARYHGYRVGEADQAHPQRDKYNNLPEAPQELRETWAREVELRLMLPVKQSQQASGADYDPNVINAAVNMVNLVHVHPSWTEHYPDVFK